MKTNLLTLIIIALISTSAIAQLTIDGQFRSRFIANHGFKVPVKEGTSTAFSFDQRTRLTFNYKTEKYTTRFTLQDARVFGSDDMLNKTGNEGNSYAFGVYEAWFELNLSKTSSLRIGRQEWNYDDMRILCWRNWWTSGLSYDGLLYKMNNKDSGLSVDLGISYNNNGTRTGAVDNSSWNAGSLKSMNFLNVKKKIGDKLTVALMLTLSSKEELNRGVELGTGTHGLILNYNKGKKATDGVFGHLSAYYQHGTDSKRKTNEEGYKSISAYLITAELGFRTMEKKLEVSAGVEMISGRDYKDTTTAYNNVRHSFDLQNSGRFPFYGGQMTHFLIQDSYKVGTKGGGYMDPYIKVKYKLSKKNIINFGFYMPMLTTDVRAHTSTAGGSPSGGEVDDNGNPVYWKGSLGNYIDVGFTRKFSKEVIFKVGFSYAMVSDIKNQMVYGYDASAADPRTLNTLGQNYFGWAMLIIKPKFFNSAKK